MTDIAAQRTTRPTPRTAQSARVRVACGAFAISVFLLLPPASAADSTSSDRDRVLAAYPTAKVLGARFLFGEESFSVPLPAGNGQCVRVMLVGARGLSFRARFAEGDVEGTKGRGASQAGAMQLSRCGPRPSRILVANESGRGALDIVVLEHGASAPAGLSSVLPERVTTAALVGSVTLRLPPSSSRVERAVQRGEQAGGTVDVRVWPASERQGRVALAAGCHAFTLIGVGRNPLALADIDAEMVGPTSELLARDRFEAPDALLEFCRGDAGEASLRVDGALADDDLHIVHVVHPVPSAEAYGPFSALVRSRIARDLRRHGMAAPPGELLHVAQGAGRAMRVPLATAARCYVAVAAVSRGTPRALVLRARSGGGEPASNQGEDAATVSFCTTPLATEVEVQVEAPSDVAYQLAVFAAGAESRAGQKPDQP